MELFIALLPLFVILAIFVAMAWLIFDCPPYLWLLYHLVALATLWICQLASDDVTDSVFHFLFVASVYCGLAIVICWIRFMRHVRR